MHLGRILIAAALLGSGVFAVPGAASAATATAAADVVCLDQPLVPSVPSGSTLAPGQQIQVVVSQTATSKAPLSECNDALMVWGFDFISGGAYGFYEPWFGGTIFVNWPGPIQPGTRLTDTLVLGIPATAAAGADVDLAVGTQATTNYLEYTVG